MFFLLGGSLLAAAQQLYRFDFVRDTNPWLSTDNAATLTLLQVQHISEGQISLTTDKGGFCNFNEPQSALTLKAEVESFYRILPRMVGYGRVSYQNTAHRQVAGSTFITSTGLSTGATQRMPFDIVEDSLVNEGNAHKDVYNILGGLSYDICRKLSLGAKIDFTAANYAKYKDLRHKNTLTDITMTAGLFSPLASCFKFGANFFYRRYVEGVTYSMYGTSEKVYKSLIDYGILTGEVETFGENGYTDKNTEQPFVSEQTGFSLQLGTGTNDSVLTWISGFSWRHRKGYYGCDTSYDIVYNRHHGNVYGATSTLTLHEHGNIHQLLFSLDIENLENDANTYRTVEDKETSAYYYEYYTPVKMSNKVWADWSIGYRGYLGMRNSIPQWTLTAEFGHRLREQTMYYYPYSRHQLLRANALSATVLRNFSIKKGILGVCGGFAYSRGSGDIYDDRLFAIPSSKQREPDAMQTYQERDYNYFVAPQYSASLSVRYSMPVPATKLNAYIQLSGFLSHVNGSASECFENPDRHSFTLSLGACF